MKILNTQHHQSIAGYTIDQTILIVAIIAILITIIIATVGWDLINRAGGSKFAAQMRQMEDSTGQFFAQHRVFPVDASTGTLVVREGNVMRVLAGDAAGGGLTYAANIDTTAMRNTIAGVARAGNVFSHTFGGGGTITAHAAAAPAATLLGTNTYLVFQFDDVPLAEALEADETIDGNVSNTVGRVVYRNTGACDVGGAAATNSTVNVCYFANLMQ